MSCLRLSSIAGLVLVLSRSCTAPALADVGEIALVEDVDGSINGSGLLAQVYLGKAACAFFKDHPDSYDALVFFTTQPQNALTGVPVGWPVKPPAKGIGLDAWPDQSKAFCTARLRHAVRMGEIAKLPDDPDKLYNSFPNSYTGIEILGHELGHQWMALITFDKGDGKRRCLLRSFKGPGSGSDTSCDGHAVSDYNQHWSFYFNSGSLMYGNSIEDLGGGVFRLSNKGPRYSPLDQYLMGLRGKTEVPPMFVVDKGDPALINSAAPPLMPGKTQEVTGKRVDFTIDDVIRAEGPRVPAIEGCHLKGAFAIVHAAGQPPTPTQIAKVDTYRKRLETFYAWATDGRGSFDTTLAGSGKGTPGCPPSGIRPDGGSAPGDATPPDLSRDAGGGGTDATVSGGDSAPTPADEEGGCSCGVWLGPADQLGARSALVLLLMLMLLVAAGYWRRRD
jgi:hypothetical protein